MRNLEPFGLGSRRLKEQKSGPTKPMVAHASDAELLHAVVHYRPLGRTRAVLDGGVFETLLAEASQSDQAKQETEADFMAAKSALEAAEQGLTDANAAAESALNAKRDSESHMTRLQAEIDALQYLLADLGDHDAAPIADQLSVSDGMESCPVVWCCINLRYHKIHI